MFSHLTNNSAIFKGGQVHSNFQTGTTIVRQSLMYVSSLGQDLRRYYWLTREHKLVYIHSSLRVFGKILYTLMLFHFG